MVQIKQLLESIYLKLGINSMKISILVFVGFIATQTGIYLADISRAYYDDFIENKVTERMEEYKVKGKPAYCSFYQ